MTIPHTINTKDVVNQNVFVVVDWSFFTFFIISTRLRQNMIAKIGIKYTLKNKKESINKLPPLSNNTKF